MTTTTTPPLHEDKEMIGQPLDAPKSVESQSGTAVNTYRFTWKVDNFSKLSNGKNYSDVFDFEGYKWRVLMFPKGNRTDHLSLYLDVANASSLPYGWERHAQFRVVVVNQIHSKDTIIKETQHRFHASESDWGFTSFMSLSALHDSTKGFLVNDTCIIQVDLAFGPLKEYCKHDSKKETGNVGPKDQGAKLGQSDTTEFDGVDFAAEKASILASLKESHPTCLESLHFRTPLVRRSAFDLLAQLLLDLKSLGKDSAPSTYADLLPVLLDLEVCGFQLADLKAYIETLRQTAEERLNVIAKKEAAEKAREELLARVKSLDEEIAGSTLPTAPISFPF